MVCLETTVFAKNMVKIRLRILRHPLKRKQQNNFFNIVLLLDTGVIFDNQRNLETQKMLLSRLLLPF